MCIEYEIPRNSLSPQSREIRETAYQPEYARGRRIAENNMGRFEGGGWREVVKEEEGIQSLGLQRSPISL